MPAEAANGRPDVSRAASGLLPAALAALQCMVAVVEASGGTVHAINERWDAAAREVGANRSGHILADLFPTAAALQQATEGERRPARLRAMPAAGPRAGWPPGGMSKRFHTPTRQGASWSRARDVTEDVLAARDAETTDAAQSAAGARLGVAQEAAALGLWEWDLENDIQAWSPAQFRLFGLDPSRHVPPRFSDFIQMLHPNDRGSLTETVNAGLAADRGRRPLEFRIQRSDTGEERWVLLLGRTIKSAPDGRPTRLVGVGIDVTLRRREHEALIESETRLRLALQAAQTFAWDWNVQSGRVEWMDGLANEVGLDEEEFGGTIEAFRALVHPDDAAGVEAALA